MKIRIATWAAIASLALVAVSTPGFANATRLAQVQAGFANTTLSYNSLKSAVAGLITVKFSVEPQLLLLGERVTLTIQAYSATQPNSTLQVYEGAYQLKPTLHQFTLTWRKSGSYYISRWSWRPPDLGCYYLHWACNIGGDLTDFYRNFSVIDNSYAVMIIGNTSIWDIHPYLHQLHIPFSFWEEDNSL